MNPNESTENKVDIEELNAANSETAEATSKGANENNTEQASEATPEEKIAQLEAQIAELKNTLLYKVAEFENYRKRTIKEKADLILNGGQKVMEAMLPVADDLERAEAVLQNASDIEALREGLNLVFQKFSKALESQGLTKMNVVGEDFNTDFHEAVAFVPGSDENKGKVIDCVQNGYQLNGKVVRYAKVAVGQ